MSEKISIIYELYEIASNMEEYEVNYCIRLSETEKQYLNAYLIVYNKYSNVCDKMMELKDKLPPIPQVNEISKKYGELIKEFNRLEEELQKIISTSVLQNVIAKKHSYYKTSAERQKKFKSVIPAIPLSVLGLLEIYFNYLISTIIFALIFKGISYIPILNKLMDILFYIREDSPDMVVVLVSAVLSYVLLIATVERIIKKHLTRKYAIKFTGIYLVSLNVIFLIINVASQNNIMSNIGLAFVGIAALIKSNSIE